MYATLQRPIPEFSPPRIPPPPSQVIAAGATDPDDADRNAHLEALMALLDDGETANGCDWSDGPLLPKGCLW
jgi:hypothetical protein